MAYTRKVEIGNATLYLGRCEDVLPLLGRVDAVVTDWPYGIGADKTASKAGGNVVGHGHRRVAKREYAPTNWDAQPIDNAIVEMVLAAADWKIIFGGNYYALPASSCWLIWDKLNGDNNFADCEMAWTNLPGAVRRLRHLWNGFARAGNEVRFDHPTQKPVGVMEWCIGHLPTSVETILDPFCGSGSTGVACAKRGKSFIGIEREESYFDIACRRIEEAYKQPDMFIAPPAPSPKQQEML